MNTRFWRCCLLPILLCFSLLAGANEGGGSSGPEAHRFTVNLGGIGPGSRYLQIDMVFEGATPEIDHEVGAYKPKIRHQVILLLTESSEAELRTVAGKQELAEKVRKAVNKILGEDDKNGVKEVLFTNFIIQ